MSEGCHTGRFACAPEFNSAAIQESDQFLSGTLSSADEE